MNDLSDWEFWILGIAIIIIAFVFIFLIGKFCSSFTSYLRRKRFGRLGKTILWDVSLEKVEKGSGFFVLDSSHKPSELFWIESLPTEESISELIRSANAYIVINPPAKEEPLLIGIIPEGRLLFISGIEY